ncbi:MAG: nucleotidyl transferase AbiEii/AbiGii toxin family protein [Bryobacterales bacterium]|nr:nucleotidyl transferase AbiEii/AbiGii toxin family protein [Bryobacterales bacterium]
MIPRDYITQWRERAPWSEDFQVEQDLIISRALVEMFSDPALATALAFRGGTALYKLYLTPPARYSEDIDLVQVAPGPAGTLMDGLRDVLDPWLGEARWKQSQGRVTFGYRFLSEDVPAMRLRLKVEINTREHFAVLGFTKRSFSVDSRWYSGMANITTFELDELLATKLRALYQRRKGRDLFDLATGLADKRIDAGRIAAAFGAHMEREGDPVTRAMFERNLAGKVGDAQFNADMSALLRTGFQWRATEAARTVSERLIALLPGEPWKGRPGRGSA